MKKIILLIGIVMILLVSNVNARLCWDCCDNPCDCGLRSDTSAIELIFGNGTIQFKTRVIPCEESWRESITLWERIRWWYWK